MHFHIFPSYKIKKPFTKTSLIKVSRYQLCCPKWKDWFEITFMFHRSNHQSSLGYFVKISESGGPTLADRLFYVMYGLDVVKHNF